MAARRAAPAPAAGPRPSAAASPPDRLAATTAAAPRSRDSAGCAASAATAGASSRSGGCERSVPRSAALTSRPHGSPSPAPPPAPRPLRGAAADGPSPAPRPRRPSRGRSAGPRRCREDPDRTAAPHPEDRHGMAAGEGQEPGGDRIRGRADRCRTRVAKEHLRVPPDRHDVGQRHGPGGEERIAGEQRSEGVGGRGDGRSARNRRDKRPRLTDVCRPRRAAAWPTGRTRARHGTTNRALPAAADSRRPRRTPGAAHIACSPRRSARSGRSSAAHRHRRFGRATSHRSATVPVGGSSSSLTVQPTRDRTSARRSSGSDSSRRYASTIRWSRATRSSEPIGPARSAVGHRAERPDLPPERGRLRVDEPRAGLVPEAVALRPGRGQPPSNQVPKPAVEVGQARIDLALPRLDALRPRRRVGLRLSGRGPCLRPLRTLLARCEPFRGPLRRIRAREGGRVRREQEQQSERVLAGELPARAGALEGGPGEIDDRLVGRRAGSLAESPGRRGHCGRWRSTFAGSRALRRPARRPDRARSIGPGPAWGSRARTGSPSFLIVAAV